MRDSDREVEIALAISSGESARAAEAIGTLRAVGAYRLVPLGPQRIRDAYFDTVDGRLRRQRLGLRVREVGGRHLVALKGGSGLEAETARGRMEIEAPWSRAGLARVLGELERRGVGVPPASSGPFLENRPAQTLGGLGLVRRQERETSRERRHVIPTEGSQAPLCELAIDAVAFELDGRRVRIRQVEIEALVPGEAAPRVIAEVRDGLLALFPEVLRPWPHGKLSTGMVLAELQAEGRLDPLLGEDDELVPAGYDRVEELLRRGVG